MIGPRARGGPEQIPLPGPPLALGPIEGPEGLPDDLGVDTVGGHGLAALIIAAQGVRWTLDVPPNSIFPANIILFL